MLINADVLINRLKEKERTRRLSANFMSGRNCKYRQQKEIGVADGLVEAVRVVRESSMGGGEAVILDFVQVDCAENFS